MGVTKLIGKSAVLENLNWEIEEGEIIGVLGPQGSGKTTLLRMLAGMLVPHKGQCFVCGRSVKDTRFIKSACGVVTYTAELYEHLNGLDNLLFIATLYQLEPTAARIRASHLMKKLDLWDKREELLSEYNDGEKMRLSLARALIHEPQLLLCDFEREFLDVDSEKKIREVIAEENRERGMTVCFFSRDLGEMAEICTGFSLFKDGKLLANGTYEYLRGLADLRLVCRIRCNKKPAGFRVSDEFIEKEIDQEAEMADVLRKLIGEGADVFEARILYPTIRDIGEKLIRKGGTES